MKIRRILCIAAVLCLLSGSAMADGEGYSYATYPPYTTPTPYSSYYGVPVNIMQNSARPYYWEVQQREGQPIAWCIENALDGVKATKMEFVGWNNEALDDIPDITFYFHDATVKDIWIRNGWDDPNYRDYARMGNLAVMVWMGEQSYGPVYPARIYNKYFNLQDNFDGTGIAEDFIDGYQRFSLPMKFEHVTKIEFYVRGWYEGQIQDAGHRYMLRIADIAFLPDSLINLYGSWIFDPYYNYYPYYPTATPAWTQVPIVTPAPAVTPVPNTGIQVLTKERLATRSGPGTNYTETGSYFQANTWVKAISAAYDNANGIWWVQVELEYLGLKRRIYTGVKRLQMSADQVMTEEAEGGAVLTRSVYAYYGPGNGYDMYPDKIPAWTSGTIWMRENLYALFEYYDAAQNLYRRVWVPESALQASNG